jgi:TM2 domain-containing membrane protein YozV
MDPVTHPTGAQMSAADYEAALMQPMTDLQRQLFMVEMLSVRKSDQTAMLFALFLGGLGAHRFYLNDMRGIIYVVFVWTFIPMLVSIVECFAMSSRVARYNKQQAYRVATRIMVMGHA